MLYYLGVVEAVGSNPATQTSVNTHRALLCGYYFLFRVALDSISTYRLWTEVEILSRKRLFLLAFAGLNVVDITTV